LIVEEDQKVAKIVVAAEACDIRLLEPVEQLIHEASAADVRDLHLDFERVSFADSTAVRIALKARDRIAAHGGRVTIKAPPQVRRLFEMTETDGLFTIVPPAQSA
jgi:anti-anti-sigma factor